MYFSPIILTAFKPYICNYVTNVPIKPEIPIEIKFQENVNSLSCAVQKFTQLIPSLKQQFNLKLNIDYMDLNQKHSSIELPSTQEFINFYFVTINRYKSTYPNQKIKYSWGQQDILILIWSTNWVSYKYSINPINFTMQLWTQVAEIVPFRSNEDCMYKWLCMRKNQLQESPWSQQQKQQLTSIVQSNNGTNWTIISKQLFRKLPNNYRTPKQCKQCWNIIVSSSFERSNKFWSPQQDQLLLQLFSKLGRKWKVISLVMKGRSQNAIKNRFNLLNQKLLNAQNSQLKKNEIIQIQAQKASSEAKQTHNSA